MMANEYVERAEAWGWSPIATPGERFRNLHEPRLCGLCQCRRARMARDSDGLPSCFDCLPRAASGEPAARPRLTAEEEARRLDAGTRDALAAAEVLFGMMSDARFD